MAKITFLGTASAVPNRNHHNTYLCVETGERTILVDCSGNPIVRLDQAGIDPFSLTDVIITHFHPDHVSGLPLLLMDLWLLGRKEPINIYGLRYDIDRIEQMMGLYGWKDWSEFFPVLFHRLSGAGQVRLINLDSLKVWAVPVCHMIPAIGLKMTFSNRSICYSSDTGPCETLVRCARGVDVLIHEATGESLGHSSPEQAGQVAQKAGVGSLYLVHYPPESDPIRLVEDAKNTFDGEVVVAKDLMKINLV